MKILHISTWDILGGAARSAFRLHRGLLDAGVESKMLVQNKYSQDDSVQIVGYSANPLHRILRRWHRHVLERDSVEHILARPEGLEQFSDSRAPTYSNLLEQASRVDVVNLHWIAGVLDYPEFFGNLARSCKVVWTLHDMNPFTGGCHYSVNCEKYMEKCGSCFQLGSRNDRDMSRTSWEIKNRAFGSLSQKRLKIVTPGKWLAGEVRKSTLLGHADVSVIPYGIDTEIFSPRDTTGLRNVLGVPEGSKVIGFVADNISNRRKGLHLLLDSLSQIKEEAVCLVSVGTAEFPSDLHTNHIPLGRVDQEQFLSMVYSLFDVFVCPSLQDNLPNTVIESLACGTPVVGFDVGGMRDMVEPGFTGNLAQKCTAKSLGDCIREIIFDQETIDAMSKHCRAKAEREYTSGIQAGKYIELYTSLLH